MAVQRVAAVHSFASFADCEPADGPPLPSWFPRNDAPAPVYDLRSGSYVHEPRPRQKTKKSAVPGASGPNGPLSTISHHGISARAKVRPTFSKAARRPVDELARAPATLPRRGKLRQPSAEARQMAAQRECAAFEARLEPLVPTSNDLIPRCGDRGPRVLNPPWGGALHGDTWARALCGSRASVPRGDGGAFARE